LFVGGQPFTDGGTRFVLFGGRNGIFQIDDDRVGARRHRLVETVRTIAGNEKIGA
jgi:hypothetical protein